MLQQPCRTVTETAPAQSQMWSTAAALHTHFRRAAIEHAVTQVFGIAGHDLRRATRGRAKVALARQVAMYLAHVGCGMSLTETGRLFDRDRTTVAHACGIIEDRRDDPLFDRALDLLEWAVPALATRAVPSVATG
jgi:chromosomal replication initiation ATPase DnaA